MRNFWTHYWITFFCACLVIYTFNTTHIGITCVIAGLGIINLIGVVGEWMYGSPSKEDIQARSHSLWMKAGQPKDKNFIVEAEEQLRKENG
jgi:hypothetical protein